MSAGDADAAGAREAATLAALFASAHRLQEQSAATSVPRFLRESARSMARHTGMSDEQMQACLPSMAFWQMFLSSALGRDTAYFTDARARLPSSFDLLRQGFVEMEPHPQVVIAAFHIAALPLVAALAADALADVRSGPRHVLVSKGNMGWLRLAGGRWVLDAAETIAADPAGLRRLMSGLKSGAITRLMILVDGPQAPGGRGTRALTNVSPAIGFRTGLLTSIQSMGIPIRPLTHVWESNALSLTWHPLLDPAGDREGDRAAGDVVSAVASIIEGLLRSHPEQWLNWTAASIRT